MRRDCARCEREVDAAYDEPKLRRWVKFYFLLGVPFIPAIPIIGSDFAVMLPMLMVYVVGFGPAWGLIKEPPKCEECGAAVSHRATVPAST
jgi:hypothetical protein